MIECTKKCHTVDHTIRIHVLMFVDSFDVYEQET